ncbi:MAG: hypothetical protein ACOC0L_01705 [bacterium]
MSNRNFHCISWTTRANDSGEHTWQVVPSVTITEERTEPGEEIPGEGSAKAPCHQPHRGPKRYAHESLHICPHVSIPQTMSTRNIPAQQEVSVALQDQQKDWDFLERHRDLVLDNKGFSLHTCAADKLHALAEDIWQFRRQIQKPGGNTFSQSIPWSHPVDTLIYGSWCLGGAYAFVALCSTYGIQARHVSMWGHSAAEVHLGGRWRYVESIRRFGEQGNNLPAAGFAEVVLDPANSQYGFCPEQQATYWQTWPQAYSVHDRGLWLQEKRTTVFCPQTARALYPVWETPRFKSDREYTYDLLPVGSTSGLLLFVLRRGQAMRRRFWIGSLDKTRSLTAHWHGTRHGDRPARKVPEDGGNWYFMVNDQVIPVKDLGGWTIETAKHSETSGWKLRMDIPLNALQENSWNTLALSSDSGGDEFLCLSGHAPLEQPSEACFSNQNSDRYPAEPQIDANP